MEWISITEKAPLQKVERPRVDAPFVIDLTDDLLTVIVCVERPDGSRFVESDCFSAMEQEFLIFKDSKVTHWMPLPEPPDEP